MRFVFGDFELDGARFELRRAGERVATQPKVLRLLLHLAAHRDRVVSNAELLAELWPDEVVSGGSIKRAVKSARRALGERADSPTSIRNVRGHGYQFVASAVSVLSESAPVAATVVRSEGARESQLQRAVELPRRSFIERAVLERALQDSWQDAEQGQGHALLLYGEAGVGKSSALQRLAAHARERGASTWLGRAADVQGAPAYWPFISMLREALQQEQKVPWLELMGDGAADLAQAVPDMRAWLPLPQHAPDIEATAARFRFFDSMRSFLHRASAHSPLLIVIDDLPLADAPTIQLFGFLARHAAGSRLLLAAAMRQGARSREADGSARELDAVDRHARHLHVPGFVDDEVARFLAEHMGGPVDPRRVAQLTQQTAGNPLLLAQLVQVCRPERPGARPRWEALETLPESRALQSAVERLVSELSEPARECLRTAALLGQRFSRSLLAELLETSPAQVIAWSGEDSASGLTNEASDPSGQSCFAHGLLCDTLARDHDSLRRSQLHARAGSLLAARYTRGAAEPSAVAYHFLQAGCYDRALHFSLLAARAATEQLAASAALLHYTHALEALDHLPLDLAQRARVLLDKAVAQTDVNDLAGARATYLQAMAVGRELGCKETLARAALGVSAPLPSDFDEEAIGLLQEALAVLTPPDALYALVASALAKALCLSRDLPARNAALALALSAAHALQDPVVRAEALGMCHEAMSEPDHLPERATLSRELSAIARSQSDSRLLLRAARAQLQDALELGDMQTVAVSLSLQEELARHVREPFARWQAKVYRAMCAMVEGNVALAVELAEAGYQLGSLVSESGARHAYLVQVSGNLRLLGQTERSRALVYEAVARYPSVAGWRCALGLSEVDVGHLDAARDVFQDLMSEGIAAMKRDAFVLSVLCPMVELCAWVGDAASAQQLYAALTPYAEHCGTIGYGIATYGPVTRYLGLLAARCEKYELAFQHFDAAAETSLRMSSPTFVCLTALSHAVAMLRAPRHYKDRARARVELQRARKLASAHGFAMVSGLCDAVAPLVEEQSSERRV